jgi:transcription factor MBP1
MLIVIVPLIRPDEYENYDNISDQLHDNDSPDNTTVASESIIDDDHHPGRKRKRDGHMYELSHEDQQHTLWADSVLDYFMLTSEDTWTSQAAFPGIPPYIDLERPVDSEGHTALHWAAAMGDIDVCRDLIRKMANTESRNMRGETPLIRAAIFANCFDRGVWPRMLSLFEGTSMISDDLGGTILHHICYTTTGNTKSQRARHYLEVVLARLKEVLSPERFTEFASSQDRNGDTPFHIACRFSRRCTKVFQAYGMPSNIRNNNSETVDYYLHEKAMARRGLTENSLLQSSSPVTGERFGAISPAKLGPPPTLPLNNLKTNSSQTFNRAFQSLMSTQISEFLQVGEAELQTKENVLAESNRALQRAEAEQAATRKRIEELQASHMHEKPGDGERDATYHALLADAEKLEEQLQHRALHKLVHQEETSPAAQMSPVPTDLQEERRRKLRALREITSAQAARQKMTRAVVEATADAGMGPKGEQMKGIILQTLAVSRENLEEDVDALIEHMEPERGGGLETTLSTAMDLDGN